MTTASASPKTSGASPAKTESASFQPKPEVFRRFLDEDRERPVTMMNLLKFRGGDAYAQYRKYIDLVAPGIEALGGRVVFGGDVSSALLPEDGSGWDALVLVEYPRRQALIEWNSSPEFQEKMARLREDSLEDTIVEALVEW